MLRGARSNILTIGAMLQAVQQIVLQAGGEDVGILPDKANPPSCHRLRQVIQFCAAGIDTPAGRLDQAGQHEHQLFLTAA